MIFFKIILMLALAQAGEKSASSSPSKAKAKSKAKTTVTTAPKKKAETPAAAKPAVAPAPAVTPAPLATPTAPGAEKSFVEEMPMIDPLMYTYNPFGKRDPFRSFLADKFSEKQDSRDPLLNYDLSKFTLTGILWGVANPRAIVRDGDGKGHLLTRGTKIGRNKGHVTRIMKDEIVIAEEFRDPLGKLIVSEYRMKLEKDKSQK